MSFRVHPDGSIEVPTLSEAVALSRSLVGLDKATAPAEKELAKADPWVKRMMNRPPLSERAVTTWIGIEASDLTAPPMACVRPGPRPAGPPAAETAERLIVTRNCERCRALFEVPTGSPSSTICQGCRVERQAYSEAYPVPASGSALESEATAKAEEPPADWNATVGSPPWWAAFHQKHGRDPTSQELTAAAKSVREEVPPGFGASLGFDVIDRRSSAQTFPDEPPTSADTPIAKVRA